MIKVKQTHELFFSFGSCFTVRKCKPKELVELTTTLIENELQERTPILHSVLKAAVTLPRQRSSLPAKPGPSVVGAMGASILKCRNQQMSAWSHKVGVVLHHEGLSEKVRVYYSAETIHFGIFIVTSTTSVFLLLLSWPPSTTLLSFQNVYTSATAFCNVIMFFISGPKYSQQAWDLYSSTDIAG